MGCDVRLIVRFSPVTTPEALRKVYRNPRVKVRYFMDHMFHTKLYIVDAVAQVGSANLTEIRLNANQELSISLREDRDEAFYELPGILEGLWKDADVLNELILRKYGWATKSMDRPQVEKPLSISYLKFVPFPLSVHHGDESDSMRLQRREGSDTGIPERSGHAAA